MDHVRPDWIGSTDPFPVLPPVPPEPDAELWTANAKEARVRLA